MLDAATAPQRRLPVGFGVSLDRHNVEQGVGPIRSTVIVSPGFSPWGRVGPTSASNTSA